MHKWRAGAYRALRGEQARANLAELVPVVIDQLSRAENPDAAVAAFDRFLAGLRAGGRFLSLLRQNPELIRFVALILGTAPRLADILAQNPHFIDPLVEPRFFGSLPDEKRLQAELARALEDTRGYEAALDAIRLFGQEQMFLIGARILSGLVSAEQAGEVFAGLADVLLRAVHTLAEADFVAAHGRMRGGKSAILALGRLGAREMTASSDLDLIVIYDFDQKHPNSDGKRPLYGAQYFARFTQRLISALTVQTNYGVLYQVDMRLRPSGRSGPVATQIDGFKSYQKREAWTWEHMALTRARVVSGPPDFAAKIEDGDPRRAVPTSEIRAPSPTTSSKCAPPSPRKRATPIRGTSNTPPARWSISNSSRNICSSSMPRRCRKFSTRRRRGPWKKRHGSACSSRRMPKCCGPRCGCSTI